MSKNVVIVESPAKAKTIEKFLGRDYKVIASYGHVRDLPKSKLGIDIANNFAPQYIIPRGTAKNLKLLKAAVEKAKTIYLATDYDREGEAIAWHILQAIPPTPEQKVERITFSEITEGAIKAAVAHPRNIDQHLVDAQQGRRVLDRLVGYSLSPVLWKKVRSGLSAGRVQSVAVKLIVDREREIQAFKPVEYWSIDAELSTDKQEQFTASLTKIDNNKAELSTQKDTDKIVADLKKASYQVASVDTKELKRSPAPPFITSTLQQEASRRLGYSAKKTMMIAQQLYEGVSIGAQPVGLISYMRTDSFNLSTEATTEAKKVVTANYGAKYALAKPRVFKKKVRGAQEAHEAIRPTSFSRTPDSLTSFLSPEQLKVYRLIWQRALACQMAEAQYRQIGADISAGPKYLFRATGRITLFDGFTKVYIEARDDDKEDQDEVLPELTEKQLLNLVELLPEQHFTQPPPRYTEASLIKKLEEGGIGRPSTYAPTISTIISRGYVTSERRQLTPQQVGFWVTDLLASHFPFVVSEQFTADMENKLDDIAEGETAWQPVIKEFYDPMAELIKTETDKIEKVKIPEIPTDEKCEVCGKPMVIKMGRFGQFMACSGWPDCKNTKAIVQKINAKCPEDGGDIVVRKSKKGRTFYGCANYPKCTYATWTKPAEPQESDQTEAAVD